MAEAGTWRSGRRKVTPPPDRLVGPADRLGGATGRTLRRPGVPFSPVPGVTRARLLTGLRPLELAGAAFVALAIGGALSGLTFGAAVHALAGRTLFDVPAERATLLLVLGPLLGLLPLAGLLLLAPSRPALLARLPALLVVWCAVAGLTAFLFGVRPFLG